MIIRFGILLIYLMVLRPLGENGFSGSIYIDKSAVRSMSVRNELGVRSNGLSYLKSEPCACERTWSCVRTNTESAFRTDLSSINRKTNMDGNVHTFKARLVAKGFKQIMV